MDKSSVKCDNDHHKQLNLDSLCGINLADWVPNYSPNSQSTDYSQIIESKSDDMFLQASHSMRCRTHRLATVCPNTHIMAIHITRTDRWQRYQW